MHLPPSDAEEALSVDGFSIRTASLGELQLTVESYESALDTAPLFEGLPNDRCPCPHWGYVLSGEVHVEYDTDAETITAGDVFHLPPDHTVNIEAGTEFITFSPDEEFRAMMEVVAANLQQMQGQT